MGLFLVSRLTAPNRILPALYTNERCQCAGSEREWSNAVCSAIYRALDWLTPISSISIGTSTLQLLYSIRSCEGNRDFLVTVRVRKVIVFRFKLASENSPWSHIYKTNFAGLKDYTTKKPLNKEIIASQCSIAPNCRAISAPL